MLEGAKAYAAGIGLVVVLAILGYLGYSYDSSQKKIATQAGQIAVQDGTIKDQANTLETQQKSDAITSDVTTKRQQTGNKTDASFDDIEQRKQAKIDEIRRQPVKPVVVDPKAPLAPATGLPNKPTDDQSMVSEVRIGALWEDYCLANHQAAVCQQK